MSHTEFLLFVTVVPTVVLLVAQQAAEDTVVVLTTEASRTLAGDVHWSNTNKV